MKTQTLFGQLWMFPNMSVQIMDEDVATSYPVNLSIELKLFWDQIVGQHSKYEDVQKFIKIKQIWNT